MDTGPTQPTPTRLRLASAYGPRMPHTSINQPAQQRADRTADRVELTAALRSEKARSLIATKVAPGIDFEALEPARADADDQPLQLYRHPADKNAAATGVEAGRRLDVTG